MSETRSKATRIGGPAAGSTAGGGPRPGLALLVLAAAQLMVVLDTTNPCANTQGCTVNRYYA